MATKVMHKKDVCLEQLIIATMGSDHRLSSLRHHRMYLYGHGDVLARRVATSNKAGTLVATLSQTSWCTRACGVTPPTTHVRNGWLVGWSVGGRSDVRVQQFGKHWNILLLFRDNICKELLKTNVEPVINTSSDSQLIPVLL